MSQPNISEQNIQNLVDEDSSSSVGKRRRQEKKKKTYVPRKEGKSKSKVWLYFEKFTDKDGVKRSRCLGCNKLYAADSSCNGTSSMLRHITVCPKNPDNLKDPQTKEKDDRELASGSNKIWKFNQDLARTALVKMIIVDELPFSFVEKEGFIEFIEVVCPNFVVPSRHTISRDCALLFLDEAVKLKEFFKKKSQRISLTTDTWTSVQTINYMCLTAHFIDDNWVLHKRIINFKPLFSHKGVEIGRSVEECLKRWGLDNIMTITVDNASSNDVAVTYLKNRLYNNVLNGKYLHMRCVAHIINLVVKDGRVPNRNDWNKVRYFAKFLEIFYRVTNQVSGSSYVTTNQFFHHIVSIDKSLRKMVNNKEVGISQMASQMREKFNKYWGNVEKMNMLMYVAIILDPRYKFEFIKFTFNNIYKEDDDLYEDNDDCLSKRMIELVHTATYDLFDDYRNKFNEPQSMSQSQMNASIQLDDSDEMAELFWTHKMGGGNVETKSELDRYLNEDCERYPAFDILLWWKQNSSRFPILSRMARDILAIPISTVASESAFSTGGRVLDNFRSSLSPSVVEALICTQDWIRKSKKVINVEEDLANIDNLAKEICDKNFGAIISETNSEGGTSSFN